MMIMYCIAIQSQTTFVIMTLGNIKMNVVLSDDIIKTQSSFFGQPNPELSYH